MHNFAWLLLALPAAGALINLLIGHRLDRRVIGFIGASVVGLAFLVALSQWFGLLLLPAEERSITVPLWDWFTIGSLKVGSALLIDPLSVTMALVVTGVGFLIHVYSASYMEHEALFQRFFIYLNFFIFSMLILVLSDSFVGMFVGWEGVGLASFLLIGFWFEQKDDSYGYYADCGKKAFIVNRIGDFGMIVAMMAIWSTLGSLTFTEVFENLHHEGAITVGVANFICLMLLLGASGKSAQIPLYVWLPDAMAGPTPVSALIHAATMVTAGIYMIARTNPLWHDAALASTIAAWIGALTALLAATMALVQTDLKKILAYSTVSQLGYMMLGVGVGAYGAAVFHLVTHAFFKALLFLGAGSVMHGLHGELDIRKMGGLRHKMPTTYWTFAVGAAALSGFPFLSGFWSKDAILANAAMNNPFVYVIGAVTALMTAFYSARLLFVPFFGKPRDRHLVDHAHESPALMTIPLQILAILAAVAGLLIFPWSPASIETWLEPVVGSHHSLNFFTFEALAMVVSFICAAVGIGMAYSLYVANERSWGVWAKNLVAPFQPMAEKKWYVDEIYMAVIVNPLKVAADWCAAIFDKRLIDGAVNGVASLCMAVAEPVRKLQTGVVPTYALTFLAGVVLMVVYFITGA